MDDLKVWRLKQRHQMAIVTVITCALILVGMAFVIGSELADSDNKSSIEILKAKLQFYEGAKTSMPARIMIKKMKSPIYVHWEDTILVIEPSPDSLNRLEDAVQRSGIINQ